ncbi:MAG: glutathione S-transferase N-terminal domain-containing protein [Oceanospirillaceae bacterium]|nr:glutathione S-transferase N-terminal domain-containing protein [Oceanospirillaceae bacterium]
MILYGSPPSPFVRKVSIVIGQLNLSQKVKLESPKAHPTEINQDYYALVPLGKIPALKLESGQFIHDSLVICDYLNEFANGDLITKGLLPRVEMLTRHSIASGAADAAVSLRYETAVRPEALQWSQWIDGQWHKVTTAIKWFEENVPEHSDLMQLDNIALACLLGYLDFRFSDLNWRQHAPQLAVWFNTINELSIMKNTSPNA